MEKMETYPYGVSDSEWVALAIYNLCSSIIINGRGVDEEGGINISAATVQAIGQLADALVAECNQ